MQITHDYSYLSPTDWKFISRGYACEGLYSLRFSYVLTEAQKAAGRPYSGEASQDNDAWKEYLKSSALRRSGHMEHIAAALAQEFKICQYDGEEALPYKSDWDLFFWCNGFGTTMQGLLSGRDYSYFTMTFNRKHAPERRQEVYDRVMRVLERFDGDENLEVAVQYIAIMDDDKIKRDAALAAPGLTGRNCAYDGMVGRVEQGSECLYFRKKRSRKHLYRLSDADILALSWQRGRDQ